MVNRLTIHGTLEWSFRFLGTLQLAAKLCISVGILSYRIREDFLAKAAVTHNALVKC